jgi:NAD(P)-dependent dehydrogenase (short-subunit alcohol dehydrogenase family)
MNPLFQGKVAIVTGGSQGIGAAIAHAFAKEKAAVAVSDILAEEGEKVAAGIEKDGGEAIFVKADVSKSGQVQALVEKTVKEFGRLDYAANNAGVLHPWLPATEIGEEDFDKTIAVNLKGVWLCMKYEIPAMLEAGGGAIVNVASIAGVVGYAGLAAYCASKGGVIQMTKAAALDFAPKGIRINVVCPGAIWTPMAATAFGKSMNDEPPPAEGNPLGRIGEPREIADAVVFLCSEKASFITGFPMIVDGGDTVK